MYEEGTTYTYSRCVEQCAAENAIHECECIDAYMPGEVAIFTILLFLLRGNHKIQMMQAETHVIYDKTKILQILEIAVLAHNNVAVDDFVFLYISLITGHQCLWLPLCFVSRCPLYLYLRMMTSPNGNVFRVTSPLCGESTGLRWIPRTKGIDVELWYFLWSPLNEGCVENRHAGDLGRYRAHYDVAVMGSKN